MQRRWFIKAALIAPAIATPAYGQPLQFLLEHQQSPLSNHKRFKLTQAVLDVLDTHYSGMSLQFWDMPFEKIDFEKRITNIVYWIDIAIQKHKNLHDLDPVWVLSQIMAESLFCEFALSRSLAAGICQFMPSTARKSYNMIIAGSVEAHHKSPYLKPHLANSLNEYRQLVSDRNKYRKATQQDATFNLNTALEWLAEGKSGMQEATRQIQRNHQIESFSQKIRTTKDNYIDYLETNITELGKRDIFLETDFFVKFDERFTYRKPIDAMVHMLANALRVRGGNILSAAAAYNAGLSRTWTNEALYTNYGTLPNFAETSQYLSRIVANYEEIANRYYG